MQDEPRFDYWVRKNPWRREWLPTSVLYFILNSLYFFFSFLFLKFIYFLLKDNCFTEFCCFLSNLNMNHTMDYSVQFSSVTQSCPTLCDPMNGSTPGLPVHHQLPEFTQTHVHRVSDAIQPSHPLSSSSPPAVNPSQHQSLFQWVNSSQEVAKVLEFQL